MGRILSERGKEWIKFSEEMLKHIEDYTVPQYGDKDEDQVTEWSAEECILAVRKYTARFGRGIRPGEEFLDIKKIAHYAALAFFKMKEKEEKKNG